MSDDPEKTGSEQQKPAPEPKMPSAGGDGFEPPKPPLTRRGTPRKTAEELGKINGRNSRKHGLSSHPLYENWKGMIRRVRTDLDYFERGMDPRWEDVAIYIEDITSYLPPHPPGKRWSIDRIDNDRGYYLDNVQWATPKMQANNRGHAAPDVCLLLRGDEAQAYTCWRHPCEHCEWETWEINP
jgi:hypothetical protein